MTRVGATTGTDVKLEGGVAVGDKTAVTIAVGVSIGSVVGEAISRELFNDVVLGEGASVRQANKVRVVVTTTDKMPMRTIHPETRFLVLIIS
jgi:hypothetical protein